LAIARKQVVVAGIERAFAHAEPDREQLADRVEQEAEVHRRHELLRLVGDRLQPPHEGGHGSIAVLVLRQICQLGQTQIGIDAVDRRQQREIA
jgi:hypothetical protein